MSDEKENEIITQAWLFFLAWFRSPDSEETSMRMNGLFELLKHSDPEWNRRMVSPPDLFIHITDGIGAKDKVGG